MFISYFTQAMALASVEGGDAFKAEPLKGRDAFKAEPLKGRDAFKAEPLKEGSSYGTNNWRRKHGNLFIFLHKR
jgi:hypothetical protein